MPSNGILQCAGSGDDPQKSSQSRRLGDQTRNGIAKTFYSRTQGSTEAIVKVGEGNCDAQMRRSGPGGAVDVDPNVATEGRYIAGAFVCH